LKMHVSSFCVVCASILNPKFCMLRYDIEKLIFHATLLCNILLSECCWHDFPSSKSNDFINGKNILKKLCNSLIKVYY
jgi:hypothetical protein